MLLPALLGFDVKIDKNFSLKEKEIIIKCLMSWHEATAQLIIFRIVSTEMKKITFDTDNTINILMARDTDKIVKIADTRHKTNILGFAFYSKNQLFAVPIMDRLNDEDSFHKVMLHEIGHCIVGWSHLDRPIGLMYSKLIEPSNKDITYADLELLINNIRSSIKK